MIEALEFCLSSDKYAGYGYNGYRRSLVIPYEDMGSGWYRVLILFEHDSIKRISNKRQNLVKKFRREGCKIDTAVRHFSKEDNNKQKVKLTFNDIIRINIKSFCYIDNFVYDKLRKIDKQEKS